MDYVYEVLSKKTLDRTDEDIGKYAVNSLLCKTLLFPTRSCNGCLAVYASKCVP